MYKWPGTRSGKGVLTSLLALRIKVKDRRQGTIVLELRTFDHNDIMSQIHLIYLWIFQSFCLIDVCWPQTNLGFIEVIIICSLLIYLFFQMHVLADDTCPAILKQLKQDSE